MQFILGFELKLLYSSCSSFSPIKKVVNFAAAQEATKAEKTGATKTEDQKSQSASASGIEDLFQDLPSILPSASSGKPQKDVKNDIMSLFDKVQYCYKKLKFLVMFNFSAFI